MKAVSVLIVRVWEPCSGMETNTAASGADSLSPEKNWGKVEPSGRIETQHMSKEKCASFLVLPGHATQMQHRNATGIAKLNTQLNTVNP